MRRGQAYVGQIARCDSIMHGSYIGELVEIIGRPRSPWRGRVRIRAVVTFPECYGYYGYHLIKRRPFEYGSVHEFGGKYIEAYDDPVPDYRESLLNALDRAIEESERVSKGKDVVARVEGDILRYLLQYRDRVLNVGVGE